ncbi:unnamed protein product [Linum tenue]|uniref:DDT domain-containing protein n=1 Tax=Linum tenue TaxID=586396 RepID=A0AAV0QRV7_9ROSI|nr:unnamed protein product [Linum tenue]
MVSAQASPTVEIQRSPLKEGKSRTKDPGLRVVGGRIYDSVNGKTCHQCRQKTMDVMARCRFLKESSKPCVVTYCHKCLLNRYGEVAENVPQMDNWHCPKCRGICNCSFCMKKRGHKPTGILTHTAKQNGFASVSELLQVKGPENFVYNRVKDKDASPMKAALKVEPEVGSPRKPGKENSLDGISDLPLHSQKEFPSPKIIKFKKTKREELKEVSNGHGEDAASMVKMKKPRINEQMSKNDDAVVPKVHDDDISAMASKSCWKQINEVVHNEIPLPRGSILTNVAGVDLAPEDAGQVLQFLEFCNAFGQAFDLKKGHAEAAIREMVKGRRGCRTQSSFVIQIHIQLLSLIQEDIDERRPTLSPTDGKNSWLLSLGDFVSKYPFMSKDFPPDRFNKGNAIYEELSISGKLKLLNFLCDETLNTMELRDIIDEQILEFDESRKEAKAKILAAKEKEKEVKKKKQDEIAKAVLAKNGAPLSISEHEALMSQIKEETSQAHAEMEEAKAMVSKGDKKTESQRSDAVRSVPMLLDIKGRAFWRLKSYNNSKYILLQGMGDWDSDSPSEKWFTFDDAQIPEVERYISVTRSRRNVKVRKGYEPVPDMSTWRKAHSFLQVKT